MKFPVAATALLFVQLFSAQVSAQDVDWTAINLEVTDRHVLPSYSNFARSSTGLGTSAADFCAAPDQSALETLRRHYHQSMDGWQAIQHIQFGPITYFNWNYRLQYWPDDKGTGARQLDALIATKDEGALAADSFARQSVGVQGFPALERLLFSDNALQQLRDDEYRCAVLQAIAVNIQSIATEVHERWQDEFRNTVATADDRGFFENAQDATVEYYKALVDTIRKYQQQKLEAVLGGSPGAVRERRAESWRSARSLRNLKLNFAALLQLYSAGQPALGSALTADDQQIVSADFEKVTSLLQQMPDAYAEQLALENGEQQLRELRDSVDALFESLETALKNTELYLGFNSLDGD